MSDLIPVGTSEAKRAETERELAIITNAILVSLGVTDITPEFTRRRDDLIAAAAAVKQVQSTEEEGTANAARSALRSLEKEIEAQATAMKTPLNAARTRIIALVDNGLAPAQAAGKRLKDMIDGYAAELIEKQRAEQRAAEEAARKVQEEARKAQEEAENLARQQRAAEEAARKAQEAAAAAVGAKAKADAEKVAAAARAEQQRITAAQQQAELDAEAASMAPTPAAPTAIVHARGVSAKMVWDAELVGADEYKQRASAEAFARMFPQYCRIDLRKSDILDALKRDQKTFDACPSLRVFERISTTGR